MRNLRILVGLMFIFTVLSPVINNIDTPINDYVFAEEETATGDQFLTLDDARTNSKQAGAKAPCPVIQNDGGNTGDTGLLFHHPPTHQYARYNDVPGNFYGYKGFSICY